MIGHQFRSSGMPRAPTANVTLLLAKTLLESLFWYEE
jgi:hypothetical protein